MNVNSSLKIPQEQDNIIYIILIFIVCFSISVFERNHPARILK